MKKLAIGIALCLCSSHLLYAGMYDPFHKTAKHKAVSIMPLVGLLPPPPLMAGAILPIVAAPLPPPTIVSAIMNDKTFINGAWYRIGDRVNDYEVTYIHNNFVGLKQANRLTIIAVGQARQVLTSKEIQ